MVFSFTVSALAIVKNCRKRTNCLFWEFLFLVIGVYSSKGEIMRRAIFIFLFVVIVLIGCGESKYPLNGVWYGFINGYGEEIKITIAFIDDFCFLSYESGNSTGSNRIKYTYESGSDGNGSGFLIFPPADENKFFVNGNVLNFTNDGIPVVLNKDVTTKAAPASLNGLWNDLEGWDMAFVNDRNYVNRDNTTDYGVYTFNGKEGSYTSRQYGAKVEFVLNGKKLDVKVNDHEQFFSRMKKR